MKARYRRTPAGRSAHNPRRRVAPFPPGHKARVGKLFRYHVNTVSHPEGRIHREMCCFCPRGAQTTLSEAHHVDYTQPFLVTWACRECHRKIELDLIKVRKRDLWDYSSLIIQRPGARYERLEAKRRARRDSTPF